MTGDEFMAARASYSSILLSGEQPIAARWRTMVTHLSIARTSSLRPYFVSHATVCNEGGCARTHLDRAVANIFDVRQQQTSLHHPLLRDNSEELDIIGTSPRVEESPNSCNFGRLEHVLPLARDEKGEVSIDQNPDNPYPRMFVNCG